MYRDYQATVHSISSLYLDKSLVVMISRFFFRYCTQVIFVDRIVETILGIGVRATTRRQQKGRGLRMGEIICRTGNIRII